MCSVTPLLSNNSIKLPRLALEKKIVYAVSFDLDTLQTKII